MPDSLEHQLMVLQGRLKATQRARSMLLAGLAALFPSGRSRAPEYHEPKDWLNLVVIDLPTGQVAFNYHDSDADLFSGLPPYPGPVEEISGNDLYERLLSLKPIKP